jgi:GntR family transcriptional regulator / MocR family aminotransferase
MVKRAARVRVPPVELRAASPVPLHRQLADQVRAMIACGVVGAGDRLPATRALGLALGVSRNTVLTAYAELLADGLLAARTGDGSYVVSGLVRRAFRDPDGNHLAVSVVPREVTRS